MDGKHEFFLTKDWSDINGGVFLFKTSERGLSYFNHVKEKMYEFSSQNKYRFGEEQTAMIRTVDDPKFEGIIKILPQRSMNSYPYDKVYGHPNGHLDKLGQNGNWQKGDFIIHIPGFGPDLFEKEWDISATTSTRLSNEHPAFQTQQSRSGRSPRNHYTWSLNILQT